MNLKEINALSKGETLYDKGPNAVKGLHVRALPKRKSFYLFYRTRDGRQRRPKIGDFPTLSIEQARQAAGHLMTVVAQGRDPVNEWAKKKAEQTVTQLFQACWKEHWAVKDTRWSLEAKRNFENHIEPIFGRKKISEVKAVSIRYWHQQFWKTPYAGNRSLEVFSKMFNFAIDHEWLPQGSNPCALVTGHPETRRTRHASSDEIQNIMRIIMRDSKEYRREVSFILGLIFTASRPSALERATWNDLRLFEWQDGRLWGALVVDGKSTAKTGQKEMVILPPQLIEILGERTQGTATVFGKMPRLYWEKLRKEAGCTDLWARDWRRSFASIGLSNGVSLNVIGEILNHQSNQTTMTYAKLMDTEKLKAISMIASKFESIFKGGTL